MTSKISYDVIIIGAGAAGLMCAIEASNRCRHVLVLEHSKKIAEKIRISGGGKCNFTNLNLSEDNFLSENPYFFKSVISKFNQFDFIKMVEKSGISYHEKCLGQLFCDHSSQDIIQMLMNKLKRPYVNILTSTVISKVETDTGYKIYTNNGDFICESLVIACGGKSIPKIGASNFGYNLAKQLSLKVVDTRPGLVPLTFFQRELNDTKLLSGISLDASVGCNGFSFNEGLLFTHRGLSGPSILQISSYWREKDKICVNLCPNQHILAKLLKLRQKHPKKSLKKCLSDFIPSKISNFILKQLQLDGNIAEQSNKSLEMISQFVHNWNVKPSGSEGYRTAEVTIGGVSTDELSSKNMESKKYPGLYFVGEIVDVTGWLGGYNFQWAWSSGWLSGRSV